MDSDTNSRGAVPRCERLTLPCFTVRRHNSALQHQRPCLEHTAVRESRTLVIYPRETQARGPSDSGCLLATQPGKIRSTFERRTSFALWSSEQARGGTGHDMSQLILGLLCIIFEGPTCLTPTGIPRLDLVFDVKEERMSQ